MTQYNSNVYDNNTISFREFLNKVFSTMAIGLLISGVVAWFGSSFYLSIVMKFPAILIISVIAELVVGLYFSARLFKMEKATAWTCYIIYSILTGLSLSLIIRTYTTGTVVFAFISTVILFVCMSVIGHTTKIDLTRFGSLIMVGLVAIMITSLLNLLLFKSEMLNYTMTVVGVLIFLLLIAYDMQKLKTFYERGSFDVGFQEKMMLLGAFSLYLDFINLFLRLLQIFGRRSNNRD